MQESYRSAIPTFRMDQYILAMNSILYTKYYSTKNSYKLDKWQV